MGSFQAHRRTVNLGQKLSLTTSGFRIPCLTKDQMRGLVAPGRSKQNSLHIGGFLARNSLSLVAEINGEDCHGVAHSRRCVSGRPMLRFVLASSPARQLLRPAELEDERLADAIQHPACSTRLGCLSATQGSNAAATATHWSLIRRARRGRRAGASIFADEPRQEARLSRLRLYGPFLLKPKHSEAWMTPADLKDYLAIVGGILGSIAFVWRIWDLAVSHLELDLRVDYEDVPRGSSRKEPIFEVSIRNPGVATKKISFAVLLIGSESDPIDDIALSLCRQHRSDRRTKPLICLFDNRSNSMWRAKGGVPQAVPLPFFYLDNAGIGNETIKFKRAIENASLKPDTRYRIYLVVYSTHMHLFTRTRVTSTLFRTPSQLKPPKE